MTRDMIKLCCHVTDRGVTGLGPKSDASKGVSGVTAQFGHAVGRVTAQFGHATSHGVIKGVRIENKVKKRLSLK